jgi:hypothetical protein
MGTSKKLLSCRPGKYKHISRQNAFVAHVKEDKKYLAILIEKEMTNEEISAQLKEEYLQSCIENAKNSNKYNPVETRTANSWLTPFDLMEQFFASDAQCDYDMIYNRTLPPEFIHEKVKNALKDKDENYILLLDCIKNPHTPKETLDLLLENKFTSVFSNTKYSLAQALHYLAGTNESSKRAYVIRSILARDNLETSDCAPLFDELFEISLHAITAGSDDTSWYYDKMADLARNKETPAGTARKIIESEASFKNSYGDIKGSIARYNKHLDMGMLELMLSGEKYKKYILGDASLNKHASADVYEFIDRNSFGLDLELYLNPNTAESILQSAAHAHLFYNTDFARKNPKFQKMFPGNFGIHYSNVFHEDKFRFEKDLPADVAKRMFGAKEH